MSITKLPPRTVKLAGHGNIVNDIAGKNTITPGYLVELINDSGVAKYQPHSTSGGFAQSSWALEQNMMNKTVDDTYSDGDLLEVFVAERGSTIWALIPSGENLVIGDKMQSRGDGTIGKRTGSNTIVALAKEAVHAAHTGLTRIRVEVV